MKGSADILVSLIPVATALGGAALGATLNDLLNRRREREKRLDEERAQWRVDTATMLGRVKALLEDSRWATAYTVWRPHDQGWQTRAQELRTRWESTREQMLRVALIHPSTEVRELTDKLITQTRDLIIRTLPAPRDASYAYQEGREELVEAFYKEAEKTWKALREKTELKELVPGNFSEDILSGSGQALQDKIVTRRLAKVRKETEDFFMKGKHQEDETNETS